VSISDIVARRYAEAFYAVAREQGRVDEVRGQLAAAVAVVTEPVVAEALRNPRLSAQDRRRLLNVFGDIGTETRNLVRLMLERGRLRVLPQVLEHYERMVDRDSGIVRARVTTAVSVDGELERRIRDTLTQRLGAPVQTTVEQDPDILGGLVIRVGDRVIDTSLRTRLQQLQAALA